MKKNKRIATASVTILAAAATAHLMQSGNETPPRMAPVAPAAAGVTPDVASARAPNPVTFAVPPAATRMDAAPATAAVTDGAVAPKADIQAPAPAEMLDAAAPPPASRRSGELALAVTDNGSDAAPGLLTYPEMPRLPAEAVMPAPLPRRGAALDKRMAATTAVKADLDTPAEPEQSRDAFGFSCGAQLTTAPRPAAMVAVTLTDPCRGGEAFILRHGPLTFTAALGPMGGFTADIPALSAPAAFTVSFADGSVVETETEITDTAAPDRAALFTDAGTGLEIHALEFGADYDTHGHVWPGNRRDAEGAARAGGGFLTVLGDASLPGARIAQIYTFPADTRHREGVVRLSVEAEVTQANCARDVAGQILQTEAGQISAPVALTLAMPDCAAVGEFLVLKNLLRDLKIASN